MDSNRRPAGYEPAAIDQLSYVAISKRISTLQYCVKLRNFFSYVLRCTRLQKFLVFLVLLVSLRFRKFLVAGAGFEPRDLRVMSPTSYLAALPRDIAFLQRLYYFIRILNFCQLFFGYRKNIYFAA